VRCVLTVAGMGRESSRRSDWIICVRIIGLHAAVIFLEMQDGLMVLHVICDQWWLVIIIIFKDTQVLLVTFKIKDATVLLSHGDFRVSLVFLWRCLGIETELILHILS